MCSRYVLVYAMLQMTQFSRGFFAPWLLAIGGDIDFSRLGLVVPSWGNGAGMPPSGLRLKGLAAALLGAAMLCWHSSIQRINEERKIFMTDDFADIRRDQLCEGSSGISCPVDKTDAISRLVGQPAGLQRGIK